MPLQPLLPLFHRLNREHFGGALAQDGQPLSSVRWSDGRMSRTAGYYKRGPGVGHGRGSEIVLSRPVLEPLPLEATESTLCHEMIHAWVDLVLQRRKATVLCSARGWPRSMRLRIGFECRCAIATRFRQGLRAGGRSAHDVRADIPTAVG